MVRPKKRKVGHPTDPVKYSPTLTNFPGLKKKILPFFNSSKTSKRIGGGETKGAICPFNGYLRELFTFMGLLRGFCP